MTIIHKPPSLPHLARQLDFDTLLSQLEDARAQKAIYARGHDEMPGLLIWNYTNKCVYDKMWTPISMHARGLIMDMEKREVVATPFPKFFNVSEAGEGMTLPDRPFEVFEKLDGSLIILFHWHGRWHAATRGALRTEQAQWAEQWLADKDLSALTPGVTYLCEAIYPGNRIVIEYAESGLVLLSAYDAEGFELSAKATYATAQVLGWKAAKRYAFDNVDELFASAQALPESEEGYILRFDDGHRLKLKGSAYCRVHALISRITPLAIWELMQAGDDLENVRKQIPEEFWTDFDRIAELIQSRINDRIARVMEHAELLKGASDKEVGLALPSLPEDVRGLIFIARKIDGPLIEDRKARQSLFREVRPTLNVLEGYEPSYALSRSIQSGE
ncbi:2'-5' RNA ligase [Erythrobacter sp. KY5]|uniref:T4 RnlA family RNA ligase n=1 Tax=Erythrobacter sp. KY5 TaxID=2011159 RepID=UPI000DBF286C|nr:T4 RnlA family RNA ligase [Erythrobacter sp. KY5]AWW72982.1 2'-5' RNA ligase [Erythrobacter sp. KY5]